VALLIYLNDDVAFAVIIINDVFRWGFKLTVFTRCSISSSERLRAAVIVSHRRELVRRDDVYQLRAGPSSSRCRQAPSTGDHRRREEMWNARTAGISEASPGRAHCRTRGSLFRQTLRQRTWLVQVD